MRQSRPSTTFMAGRDFAYPLFGDVAERRDDSGEPATHSATERSDVAELPINQLLDNLAKIIYNYSTNFKSKGGYDSKLLSQPESDH